MVRGEGRSNQRVRDFRGLACGRPDDRVKLQTAIENKPFHFGSMPKNVGGLEVPWTLIQRKGRRLAVIKI